MWQHRLAYFILSLLLSTWVWADNAVPPEISPPESNPPAEVNPEVLSPVDQILAQIQALSRQEQSELIKKLIAQRADEAIDEAKVQVDAVKKKIQTEINNPKYQEHLDKAKRKLKKLYDLFQDEEEAVETPSTVI